MQLNFFSIFSENRSQSIKKEKKKNFTPHRCDIDNFTTLYYNHYNEVTSTFLKHFLSLLAQPPIHPRRREEQHLAHPGMILKSIKDICTLGIVYETTGNGTK